MRLSTRQRQTVAELVGQHMRFQDVQKMKLSRLRRFLGQADFDLHLALHKADCLGCHGLLGNYEFCMEHIRQFAAESAQEALLPPPILTGDDLIALGLKPGPVFRQLLEAAREEQLEGKLTSREQAVEWVRERIENAGKIS